MSNLRPLPVRLYLPLLAHPDHLVRRQASLILHLSYGAEGVPQLHALLKSPEPEVREQARHALRAVQEFAGYGEAAPAAEGIHVTCLGIFEVRVDGRALQPADWSQADGGRAGGQKVQAALAYLIHCGGRGSSREALGAAVWGGAPSASSIARTLTTLRQALLSAADPAAVDAALVVTEDRCLLSPASYRSDVALFERASELAVLAEETEGLEAAAPLYAQALDLYGGPYMVDIPRGAGWMLARRESLAGDFLIATERLAEHLFAQARYEECIRRCQIALNEDATADDITAWLLRAYAQLGHHAELEHAFRRYKRAARIAADDANSADDPVVAAHRAIIRSRAHGA